MTQEQLAHTAFPLGVFKSKEQVRELAQRRGFVNADKPDSQDICFVREGSYADFIKERTGREYPPGDFVDEEGHVLGRHRGLIRYTIGQRKGLGLALPAPLYVKEKDMESNRVILAPEKSLFRKSLIADDFNWILPPPGEGQAMRVTAKPRYRAKEAAAKAWVLPDGTVKVVFDEPQRALTCGQAVVLYDGERVAGGGTITAVE
jgi:tRNA-specific 2-thiouridylase